MGERKKLRGLITIIRNLTVSWEGDCGGIDCDLYKRLRPPPTPLWKHRCFFVHEWNPRSNPRLHHRSITYIALYRRLLRKHCFRSSNGETIFPNEQNFHAGNSSTPLTKFMFINDAYCNSMSKICRI